MINIQKVKFKTFITNNNNNNNNNILEFVNRLMTTWQTELTSCRESLTKVNIGRGIFQGDFSSLSPLLFFICMILLTHALRKTKARYFLRGEEKITIFCLWIT